GAAAMPWLLAGPHRGDADRGHDRPTLSLHALTEPSSETVAVDHAVSALWRQDPGERAAGAGARLDDPHKTRPAQTYQMVTPTAPNRLMMANSSGSLNTKPSGMSIWSRPTRMPSTDNNRSVPPRGAHRPARL